MKTKLYNYKEALARVTDFLGKSGIREYCRTKCKGGCCWSCHRYQSADEKIRCSDKLPCAFYMCGLLKSKIDALVSNSSWKKIYLQSDKDVCFRVYKRLKHLNSPTAHCYHDDYGPELFTDLKIVLPINNPRWVPKLKKTLSKLPHFDYKI